MGFCLCCDLTYGKFIQVQADELRGAAGAVSKLRDHAEQRARAGADIQHAKRREISKFDIRKKRRFQRRAVTEPLVDKTDLFQEALIFGFCVIADVDALRFRRSCFEHELRISKSVRL